MLIGRDWGCNTLQIRPVARAYDLSTGSRRLPARSGVRDIKFLEISPRPYFNGVIEQCNTTHGSIGAYNPLGGNRARRHQLWLVAARLVGSAWDPSSV